MKSLRPIAICLLATTLAACASLSAEPNRPLETAVNGPAYRITTIPDATSPELFVALAFSGGGKRSAAFGYGALTALREITVDFGTGPRKLTQEIDVVTGVSGGSFTASSFALKREALFDTYTDQFLKYDLNADIFGLYLIPWRWDWLFNPNWGTNDEMARIYDDLLFQGTDYGDLARLGRPYLGVQATDFANEAPFIFGQDTFDWICSDITTLPVARAVAASNGFPVLFSPISLRNYAHDETQSCRRPAWVDKYMAIDDELSRRRQLAELATSYLDKRQEAYVHLLDGGVADNLALRGLVQLMAPTTEPDALDEERVKHLRHVIIVSVDGQAEPDRAMTDVPYLGSVFRVLGAVASTAIDRYGYETLIHAREMTRRLADGLASRGCPGPVVEGKAAPCRKVEAQFAHVSLGDLQDDEQQRKLAAIPTGLTIDGPDVDALIVAGHDAILCDRDMRQIFASLPNVRMPPLPARCRAYRPGTDEVKASAAKRIAARVSRTDRP
ncbi:MAG: patatin-like phospholipase family protein [Alphaproteobacteria bacterium]|nr:patatin-like phospholipase family protein [Alphaproteobacteria bacterium]